MSLYKGETLISEIRVGMHETNLQSKLVTPTESLQTISPDAGYDGLSDV